MPKPLSVFWVWESSRHCRVWGAMLNDARNHLLDPPHMVVFPALAVMLAVLAFNLLGDACRDWLDPRTRSQMTALDQSR